MQLIRDKVGDRFVVSPDVTLSSSTVDRFVQAFRVVISENETFVYQSTEVSTITQNFNMLSGLGKLFRMLCRNAECQNQQSL